MGLRSGVPIPSVKMMWRLAVCNTPSSPFYVGCADSVAVLSPSPPSADAFAASGQILCWELPYQDCVRPHSWGIPVMLRMSPVSFRSTLKTMNHDQKKTAVAQIGVRQNVYLKKTLCQIVHAGSSIGQILASIFLWSGLGDYMVTFSTRICIWELRRWSKYNVEVRFARVRGDPRQFAPGGCEQRNS